MFINTIRATSLYNYGSSARLKSPPRFPARSKKTQCVATGFSRNSTGEDAHTMPEVSKCAHAAESFHHPGQDSLSSHLSLGNFLTTGPGAGTLAAPVLVAVAYVVMAVLVAGGWSSPACLLLLATPPRSLSQNCRNFSQKESAYCTRGAYLQLAIIASNDTQRLAKRRSFSGRASSVASMIVLASGPITKNLVLAMSALIWANYLPISCCCVFGVAVYLALLHAGGH